MISAGQVTYEAFWGVLSAPVYKVKWEDLHPETKAAWQAAALAVSRETPPVTLGDIVRVLQGLKDAGMTEESVLFAFDRVYHSGGKA